MAEAAEARSLDEASRASRLRLVELATRYHAAGWMLGTSGNLSARFHGTDGRSRAVLTASGCDKGRLGPEDFVEVDLDGRVHAAGPQRKPSAETSIHLAVYQRLPDVAAVHHVHTVASTLARPATGGVPGEITFEGLEMIKGWGLWEPGAAAPLPVFPNHAHVPDIARDLGSWLDTPRPVPAMLIAGHGITAWGRTPEDALRHVEITEFLCRVVQRLG
ncbi:MAG: methylthioribulose 1-phosphate dehydratase [Deltaproteobacteria bacterium]|nr:methylthioribulose 1-phosphate dehydratase [Deltaproteobacteria bacterium]MCB9785867.1 methylthioribulose 1-phosphate dehydratase [Deltaproteobacteria bacterium]